MILPPLTADGPAQVSKIMKTGPDLYIAVLHELLLNLGDRYIALLCEFRRRQFLRGSIHGGFLLN